MLDLLSTALALFFISQFIRALPWRDDWRNKKPLSCHACMSGWSTILAWYWLVSMPVLVVLGAAGLCYLLMHLLDALPRQWPLPPSDEA